MIRRNREGEHMPLRDRTARRLIYIATDYIATKCYRDAYRFTLDLGTAAKARNLAQLDRMDVLLAGLEQRFGGDEP